MSNYNWSIDDIKNKIKLIEEFEDKEKYRTDIITLNSMLNKTIEKRNITSSIEHELENDYELFQEWAKSFKQSVEKYNNNTEIPQFGFKYLSDDDCLSLINDFFKTRHPYVYQVFQNEFDKKDFNLRMKEGLFYSSAVTYHLKCFNQSYIDITRSNSIFDLVNLAHEYGHAIGFNINPDIVNNDYFLIIDDLDGVYFQQEFINWLIENDIYADEAVLAKLFINQEMYCKAHYTNYMYNLQKIEYLISYLTSIELGYHPKKDELLVRILTHKPNSIDNMLSVLNDFIILNNSADTYQKTLKKEAQKYFS